MDYWVWSILLLLTALGLGFLELFVPSGGVLAVLAILAILGCLVFAFMHHLAFGLVMLILIVAGLPFLVWYMLKIWQSTPIGRRMLLDPAEDPALAPDAVIEHHKSLLGKTGTAKSLMMPGGIIEIAGRSYDAVSEGLPIDPHTPVEVVHVDGINLTVRAVANFSPSPQVSQPSPPQEEPEIEDPFA